MDSLESIFNDFSYDKPSLEENCSDSPSNNKDSRMSKGAVFKKGSQYKSEKYFKESSQNKFLTNFDATYESPPPELVAEKYLRIVQDKHGSYETMPESDSYSKYKQFSYSNKNTSDREERFNNNLYEGHQNSNTLNYRQQIDRKSNECFKKSMIETSRVHSLIEKEDISSEVLKKRLDNLCYQQQEFDNFVSSVKMKLTVGDNSENNNYRMESLIKSIDKEAEIFTEFFPAYGVKSKVFEEIKKSQVTIITADPSYFFNIALPLLLYNECAYLNHSIIACESNEILSQVLQKRLDSFFPNLRAEEEKSFLRSLQVLSVEKLLECISNTSFVSERSFCIIFNIPLKRSVFVDIVLSSLRDLLANQKHFKLILLLSKYDNHEKFNHYFSGTVTCSSLKMPDLIFPVKTVWKSVISSIEDDFIDDVVNSVISVHVLNKSGDIIVHLPSASDVLSTFERLDRELHNYQFSNLILFCIVDESSIKKYLIDEENCFPKRRVYLVINGCEEAAFPFIKYVIDCGIQKDAYFDQKRDINTFEKALISRARAKLRRELAGIHDVGTCYRIYCKKSYAKMHPKEYAEIFCINPIHSIIKVFQHQPYTSGGLQFVESLPSDVLAATLNLLKDCGALDEKSHLTSFGEYIAKLPFPTKYSQFILLALQWGIAYEAIIIVAFFMEQAKIFLEPKDSDHQRLIDAVKLDFNMLDSDSLTYLNIFKAWKENGFKKVWCGNRHLDHAALKSIRLKVNDMCHVIQECIGKCIKEDFGEQDDMNYLIEILHLSFRENLCVFTGHHRIGYQILATHELALVHPSSFLFLKEEYPRFVIYDRLIKGKKNFICNLTSIPFNLLMKFLQDGTLKFSHSDCFEEKLEKRVIEPIGEKVISQVLLKNDGRKVRELEENIKKDVGAKVVLIEPVLGKGCVIVYAFKCDIFNCCNILQDMLKKQTQALINEEETKLIELKKGQNSTFVEIKWIKGAQTESFKHVLVASQANTNTNIQSSAESESESAQSSSINYTLKLSWPRRTCTGDGFLTLNSREDFRRARKLGCECVKVGEKEVYLEVSRFKDNQLNIFDIARDITQEDLTNTFASLLPGCEFKVELCYSPPFETSSEELHLMKKEVEKNCREETNLVNFDVQVLKPEPSSSFMEARINVFEERCLETEAKNISATKVDGMKISCKAFYFSNIKCNSDIYKALRDYMQDELERFDNERKKFQKECFFKVVPRKDAASEDMNIELSSNDIEVMRSLQLMINHLLDGIKLDKNDLKSIHKLFCHGGHVFLKSVGKTRNVYILENFETKTIRLYGTPENCAYVKQCIHDFLKDTENEIAKTIALSNENHNRGIMKLIIQTFGVNLQSFIELYKLRSAALDIKSCSLMMFGKKDDVQKAEECVKELSAGLDPTDICSDSSLEEICPVCGCCAENLTFRLELCGHLYCSGCIEYLVEQATLPLQCSKENCSADLILGDIKYVLDENEAKIKELSEKSLKNYLERNHDKIFYCPAADCSFFIFKSEQKENKWQCPLCKNFICIPCGVVFHEGLTCDIYKGSKNDPDYSFKVWNRITGTAKHCPHCNTAIEKNEGCNHITCIVCKGHFCWLCGVGFKTDDDTYRHIYHTHTGQLYA